MSSEWPVVRFDEIFEITSSKRVKRADYVEQGVPFFRSKEIIEKYHGNEISTELFITDEHFQGIKAKFGVPITGDILLTSVGTLGIPYQVKKSDKFYFKDGNLTWFRNFSDNAVPRFIYYWLASTIGKRKLDEITIGSTQKALTIVALKSIALKLPSKKIQNKIVIILDSLNNQIFNNRQINQTLESMAQAIFQSWFVDFDPVKAKIAAREQWQTLSDGERREWLNEMLNKQAFLKTCLSELTANGEQSASEILYLNIAAMTAISSRDETSLADMPVEEFAQLYKTASLFPERLVESELGEIPEGWEVTKVESILERIKVKSRYKKDEVIPYGKTPVYEQGADILLGFHDGEPSIIASIEKPAFIFGDHTCITHLACHSFDISQNVIPLRGACRASIWTYYAIRELQKFQEYRRHWSELIVKDICLPNKKITDNFSIFLSKLILKKEQMVTENLDLTLMRDTLLPKLLTGELDISALTELADIEPEVMDV
tara:strand:- start:7719 stop:9188 length:1470 start_codon:yes stop_codon:yes gene_type:complete